MLCSSEELSGMQAEAERPGQQNLAANQQDPGEPTDRSVRQQGYTLTPAQIQENRHLHTQTHTKESRKHIKCTLETQKQNKKQCIFNYTNYIMQLFTY